MTENPIMIVMYLAIAGYVGKLYWADTRTQLAEGPQEGVLPGAFPATWAAILIGTLGALVILGLETGGELALGVAAEQSEMLWYLVFPVMAAGVVEEVIFRGYLVVDKKGRAALIGSCLGFSLLFALIHPHLWSLEDGFHLTLTTKGFFSTALLLVNSLWFYACRFAPWNPTRSIFPCMIAHAASNLGVYCVKLAQGYVVI
jgi:membrane protease YdiL (CAAX protease family)